MEPIQYNSPLIRVDAKIDDENWAIYNAGQLNAFSRYPLDYFFVPQRLQTWNDKQLLHTAISACGSFVFYQIYGFNYGRVSMVLLPYAISSFLTSFGAPSPIDYFNARDNEIEVCEDVENAIRYLQFNDGSQMLIDMILDARILEKWRFDQFMQIADTISLSWLDEDLRC